MARVLYYLAIGLIKTFQSLPLLWVAWIGRRAGALAYWLDVRHRRVAVRNLTQCFGGEKSPAQIRALAHENFRRLGENYCSAIKTAAMTWAELEPHVQFVHLERIARHRGDGHTGSCIAAIGHFGNFELYARIGQAMPGFQSATTYRALKQPALNRLLQSVREQSGCLYFERRTDGEALKVALKERSLLLGLLADQHAGERGVGVPFLGHLCSTSAAPAVLALRYHCPLHTGLCYRVGLARWCIEAGDEIPTQEGGTARSVEAITADINRAFEAAVRRDPANWFWVHNRWKPFRSRSARNPASPATGHSAEADQAMPLSG